MQTDAPSVPPRSLSRWEWLPAALVPVLALVHFFVAEPGGMLSRCTFFVCLGLIPGTLWRLAGKRSWNVHRVFFALGLIVFVLENPALRPDSASWEKIKNNWHLVAAGFLVSSTQPFWGTLRTHRLLTDSGVAIGMYDTFKLCLAGWFFSIFLPGSTGGDAYRVLVLTREYKSKLAPAIASITLDRTLGLPALLVVVLLGMALDHEYLRSSSLLSNLIPFIAVAAALCVGFVCYLAFAGKARRERNPGACAPENAGWFARLHTMLATNVTRRATLPLTLFYSFVSHCACIADCLCFGLAMGVEGVPALRYFLIVPMAMTINAVPGAPGGVGQGELAMATLLAMAAPGAGNAQAGVMVMLLMRLSNMAIGLAGGLCHGLSKWR